jgi:hypothetical protein
MAPAVAPATVSARRRRTAVRLVVVAGGAVEVLIATPV